MHRLIRACSNVKCLPSFLSPSSISISSTILPLSTNIYKFNKLQSIKRQFCNTTKEEDQQGLEGGQDGINNESTPTSISPEEAEENKHITYLGQMPSILEKPSADDIAPGSLEEGGFPKPKARKKPVYKAKPREKPSILTREDRAKNEARRKQTQSPRAAAKEGVKKDAGNNHKLQIYFNNKDSYEALVLFRTMCTSPEPSSQPNEETYDVIITGFLKLKNPWKAFEIWKMIIPSCVHIEQETIFGFAAAIARQAYEMANLGGTRIQREMYYAFKKYGYFDSPKEPTGLGPNPKEEQEKYTQQMIEFTKSKENIEKLILWKPEEYSV